MTQLAVQVSTPHTSSGNVIPRLTASENGYSDSWTGPPNGEHVMVDGLFDGWLINGNQTLAVKIKYGPTPLIEAAYIISAFAALGMFLTLIGVVLFKGLAHGATSRRKEDLRR